MSLPDWLRGWQAVDAGASHPSWFDLALAELDAEAQQRPKPGEQVFIPMSEMTAEDWLLASHSEPKQQPRPLLFDTPPDPNSWPMPQHEPRPSRFEAAPDDRDRFPTP